ncbi:MAG: exopolysaccharide biosynthesis protein [Mastigocoleus sp. MO_167.B18]|nr:exopolysaccharide biosynthesis protein [Mastigocoleus sp. MO_167.B18]
MAKLSKELNHFFFEEKRPDYVTLEDILQIAGDSVFGFLFVVLALPSALPLPAPGYAAPFGVLIFILAIQFIIGRKKPWLPKKMANHRMKLETVQKFIKAGTPWLRRIEAITRPRLPYVCTTIPGRLIIGVAIALMSISMCIPIPLTNTLPAIGIFFVGFGLLEDDGFISLIGLVICLMGATLTSSIFIFGYKAVEAGIAAIKALIFGAS